MLLFWKIVMLKFSDSCSPPGTTTVILSYLTDPHPSSNYFFTTAGQTELYKLKVTQSTAESLQGHK